jgi:hypothetical protein
LVHRQRLAPTSLAATGQPSADLAELAGLATAEPSPELAVRIRQAVAETKPSPAWRFGWLWPATATAATLLVALAVFLGRGTPSAPESRMAVDAHGPQSAGSNRTVEATGESVAPVGRPEPHTDGNGLVTPRGDRPVPVVDGTHDVVTPRSSGQAGRRGVRSPGGSLGTRLAVVPREGRAPEPEVLVPPGETEALLRFVALVHRQRLAPTSLAATGQPSADLAELALIDIKPLEIVPLDPAETSGT